jgi:hypothetical protein
MTLDKDDKAATSEQSNKEQRKPHPWLPVVIAMTGVTLAIFGLLATTKSGPFAPSPPPNFTANFDKAQVQQLDQLNNFLQTGKETADVIQLHLTRFRE